MMTKAANIEREQTAIEYDITQRLMNMEDVRIDTGRKIFAEDVIEEMRVLDPDRFMLAIFLCAQQRQGQLEQGRGIMADLRREAITSLIRKHSGNLYTLARQRFYGNSGVVNVA